jgi:putative Holliday junction resolvase
MGRLLCLDYGRKRVGIAVTDPLKIIASALETVPTHKIRDYLKSYLGTEDVEAVVIGDPKTMQNKPSEAKQYIEPFARWFHKQFPDVPLVQHDERFTSRLAEQAILNSGIGKMARRDKSLVDKVSASLILQSYLDWIKHTEENK